MRVLEEPLRRPASTTIHIPDQGPQSIPAVATFLPHSLTVSSRVSMVIIQRRQLARSASEMFLFSQ